MLKNAQHGGLLNQGSPLPDISARLAVYTSLTEPHYEYCPTVSLMMSSIIINRLRVKQIKTLLLIESWNIGMQACNKYKIT